MYSIQDVSRMTGLSVHTLRYYEKQGLLSRIGRSRGGIRQYSEDDMEELGLVCCLKNTGMSLQEIARFVRLTHEGDTTLRDRVELLHAHRDAMVSRMGEMQKHLEKVTCKLHFFSAKLEEYEKKGNGKEGRS